MHTQPTIRKRLLVTLGAAIGGGLFVVAIMWLFYDVVIPSIHGSSGEALPDMAVYYGGIVALPALKLDFMLHYLPGTVSPYLVNGAIAGVVCGCVMAFWTFMVKPALKSFDDDQPTNVK